jgi:hypothetical protein
MGCPICSEIPDFLRANTGRDERLPDSVRGLRSLELGTREDLLRCESCGALYVWEDDSSWTGSGNNDEERVSRIPEPRAAIVRACLDRGDASAAEVARGMEDGLLSLPWLEKTLAVEGMRKRYPELARCLFPRMVAELARTGDNDLRHVLATFTYEPMNAAALLEVLERTPPGKAEALFALLVADCRKRLGRT